MSIGSSYVPMQPKNSSSTCLFQCLTVSAENYLSFFWVGWGGVSWGGEISKSLKD